MVSSQLVQIAECWLVPSFGHQQIKLAPPIKQQCLHRTAEH
jgi:hypothetical protein